MVVISNANISKLLFGLTNVFDPNDNIYPYILVALFHNYEHEKCSVFVRPKSVGFSSGHLNGISPVVLRVNR
jgi:hypothetical protein